MCQGLALTQADLLLSLNPCIGARLHPDQLANIMVGVVHTQLYHSAGMCCDPHCAPWTREALQMHFSWGMD